MSPSNPSTDPIPAHARRNSTERGAGGADVMPRPSDTRSQARAVVVRLPDCRARVAARAGAAYKASAAVRRAPGKVGTPGRGGAPVRAPASQRAAPASDASPARTLNVWERDPLALGRGAAVEHDRQTIVGRRRPDGPRDWSVGRWTARRVEAARTTKRRPTHHRGASAGEETTGGKYEHFGGTEHSVA
jgi:hypothetical protein